MRQRPSSPRTSRAPRSRMACAVLSTSSPSRSPATVLSPTVKADRMRARCEIDLSPGTRARPERGPPRRADRGEGTEVVTGCEILENAALLTRALGPRHGPPKAPGAIDSAASTSQVKHPSGHPEEPCPVATSELGTKRVCSDTGRKFYDLNKTPVVSPYTGKIVPIAAAPVSRSRPKAVRAPVPEEVEVAPEAAEAELVSLEDAEAEQQGKIALEEHFAIEATLGDAKVSGAQVWDKLGPRLIDIQDLRLKEMDKHGVEKMILSLNAPAVQAIHDVNRAIAVARESNDVLAAHE